MSLTHEQVKERMRESAADAVAAGKCRSCRKPNPNHGVKLCCDYCLARNAQLQRFKRLMRIKEGTCAVCHRKPFRGGRLCKRHTMEGRATGAKYRANVKERTKQQKCGRKKKSKRMN